MDEWRYTNVAPMARIPFAPAPPGAGGLTAKDMGNYTFSESACCQMVFVNGSYCPELSSLQCVPRGVRVRSLAASLETDQDLLEPHLAQLAPYVRDAFTALNTAFI